MDIFSFARMSTRYRCSPSSRPERPIGSAQMVVTTRASSSAVLTMPACEGSSRYTTASRDNAEARTQGYSREQMLVPGSSGLDFIDLVGLDDSTVWNRLQDAVTYRVLVDRGPAKEVLHTATQFESFNIKQLKSYRDNVTRNLAPTVARGFANAARGAGHVISATPSTASPSAAVFKTAQRAAAPAPAGLRPQQEDAATAATPLSMSAQAQAAPLPSSQQQGKACSISAGIGTPLPSISVAGGRPAQRVSASATGLPVQPIQPVEEPTGTKYLIAGAVAAARSSSGRQAAATAATAATTAATAATTAVTVVATAAPGEAPVPDALSLEEASASADGALATSVSVNGGRRRGNRGAGRGRLLAVAGRHASGAAASVGPAWT
ncbi:hypothetical protein Vafri_14052 [Volvox africanus]|uniref:Uncharacterized protein n=1 Tax=Volvox africanus TaxID=51714 RepID=A0A8J4BD79_9CHLO|nr:hypothetical protein Vafri_14052 [Volvox africanus]